MNPPALQVVLHHRQHNHEEVSADVNKSKCRHRLSSAKIKTEENNPRDDEEAITTVNITKPPLLDAANIEMKSNNLMDQPKSKKDAQERVSLSTPDRVVKRNSKAGFYERRRSSARKSVHGLIIEFDMENEEEANTFALCDDYKEDLRPVLNREASNESLEELRTRLEALEHERSSQQLPEHDDYGWGEECWEKKVLEALEGNHHSSCMLTGHLSHVEDEEDEYDEGAEESAKANRRSTARSSIHGLVLEYDFSDSQDED
jgi:hypothetical protein